MGNFDLKKYLAEGRLFKEEFDFDANFKYGGKSDTLDGILKLVANLPDTVEYLEVPYDLYSGPRLATFRKKELYPPFNIDEIKRMIEKVVEMVPTELSKKNKAKIEVEGFELMPTGEFDMNPKRAVRQGKEDVAPYSLHIDTKKDFDSYPYNPVN